MQGKEYVLDVDANDTMFTTKIALQKKTGIPPDQQRLIYGGKELKHDGVSLTDYSISTNSTLHLLQGSQYSRGSVKNVVSDVGRKSGEDTGHDFRPLPPLPPYPWYDGREHAFTPSWLPKPPTPPSGFFHGALDDVDFTPAPLNSESLPRQVISSTNSHTTQQRAVDISFDEDGYIVDPGAHFKKLKVLEQETVEGSHFFKYKDLHATPEPFRGDELEDIRNVPDHLRIRLEDLLRIPALGAVRTAIDRSGGSVDRWWRSEARVLTCLCQSYFIICRVLQRLELLRAARFSTYFFSFLRLHKGTNVAEIVKLQASLVEGIKVGVEEAIDQILDDPRGDNSQVCLSEYVEVPCAVLLEDAGILRSKSHSRNSHSILTLCRMTALLLDLAMVSYVGSHGSPFCARFLTDNRQMVEVQGVSEDDFSFSCSMQSLACLHGFLDRTKAWVFEFHSGRQLPTQMKAAAPLSILARMEDFADIWGPVWAIPAEDGQIKQYNVSKGVICKVKGHQNEFHAVQCHWYSWASYHRRRVSTLLSKSEDLLLAKDDLLLIGAAFQQNRACRYTLDDYEAEYGGRMGVLGTTPSYWKADSRVLSFGLSKVLGVTVSGSQKLIPQTSIKQHILAKWTNNPTRANPGILNQYLGLEISSCTGNARRISLKTLLLLRTVSPLLERQIPSWSTTDWGSNFKAALRSTNTQAIFDVWRHFAPNRDQMATLVCCALEVLDTTGRGTDHFLAGFLHGGQESSVSIDYGRNDWAEFLEDSNLNGVYAVINDVCLECRLPNHAAMTCTNTHAYTVLQTQFKVDNSDGDHEYNRISVSPYRRFYQRADAGSDRISLFRPESQSFFTLSRFSALNASEIREQCPGALDFYLRASSKSYHGRKDSRRYQTALPTQEARDVPDLNDVRDVRFERRPAPPSDNPSPVGLGNYDDRERRPDRHVRRRARSSVHHRAEARNHCDPADEGDILYDIKNYVIEDDIDNIAIWHEDAAANRRIEDRPQRMTSRRIDGNILGPRDYARQVR